MLKSHARLDACGFMSEGMTRTATDAGIVEFTRHTDTGGTCVIDHTDAMRIGHAASLIHRTSHA
jgi:hypothetical protein